MEITSEREKVRTVAQRWERQYGSGYYARNPQKQAITKLLFALDPEKATASDVEKIIGNSSWVEPWECKECTAKNWDVVQLGDELDYESYTTYVCLPCLEKAVNLVRGRAQKEDGDGQSIT